MRLVPPLSASVELPTRGFQDRSRSRSRTSALGYLRDHISSVAWVLACGDGYRRPEPVRLADRFVAIYKKTGRFCGGLQ